MSVQGVLDRPPAPVSPLVSPSRPAAARRRRRPRRVLIAGIAAAALVPLVADSPVATPQPDRMSCSQPATRFTHRFPAAYTGEVFVRFSLPHSGSITPLPARVKVAWGPFRAEDQVEALGGDTGGTMLVFAKLDGAEKPTFDTVFVANLPVCAEFGIGPDFVHSVPAMMVPLVNWTRSTDVV